MRIVPLAAVALCSVVASAEAAPASEWVGFPSATTAPTPFALKRAQARGVGLKQEPGTPLRGLLVRPEGAGPFPAVALLHGCDGVQAFQERWADDLASWGYVALLVDSHGPRGIGNDCARWPPTAGSRTDDAFGALAYLRGSPLVDATRIGVVGWSTGGRAAMRVVAEKGPQQDLDGGFAASIALYPAAWSPERPSAPLLVLIGEADDCTPAARVRRAIREVGAGPFPLRLEVLPEAAHGFDDPRHTEPVRLSSEQAQFCFAEAGTGRTLLYSKAAREAAAALVRVFLEQHLR